MTFLSSLSSSFLLLLAVISCSTAQKQSSVSTQTAASTSTDFTCPEDFGYFPHPSDCTQYYVCVFGGALLESCTGGLMYSHDLQTCDWPRNVYCYNGSIPLDNNIEQSNQQGQQQQDNRGNLLRSRGSSTAPLSPSSSRANPSSYSYNPIKIETYGQLSRAASAAAEDSITGGKKRVVLPDDEYQQQRSGRSYEGSLPNYKEEIYQQNQGRKKRSLSYEEEGSEDDRNRKTHNAHDDLLSLNEEDYGDDEQYDDHDPTSPEQSQLSHRSSSSNNIFTKLLLKPRNRRKPDHYYSTRPRALFNRDSPYHSSNHNHHETTKNSIITYHPTGSSSTSIKNRGISDKKSKDASPKSGSSSSSSAYSHRVSSPGNILYPPSYYQTPTYGLVNIDNKLRTSSLSSQSSSKLRSNLNNYQGPFSSSSESPLHLPHQPPRVIKITSSTTTSTTTNKPPAGDNAQTGSYFSSQQRLLLPPRPQTILDYHAPVSPQQQQQQHHHQQQQQQLVNNKPKSSSSSPSSPPPTSYSYTPQQQQRWNLITQTQQPPGQPGYYYNSSPQQQQAPSHYNKQQQHHQQQHHNSHHEDEKRIVLKTPSSPLLLSHPSSSSASSSSSSSNTNKIPSHSPSSHSPPSYLDTFQNNHHHPHHQDGEQEKRLSDFVTNAYLNRLKGTNSLSNNNHNNNHNRHPQTILDYRRPQPHPHHHHVNEIPKSTLPFINFGLGGGGRNPFGGGGSPHHIQPHHQNHIQQLHQQVLPNSKGSVSRGKYTGTPNKYYDNRPAVVPQQDDYAPTADDVYVNQRYAANVGNQSAGTYFYSPAGATASAADDDDASYYVYDDEEEDAGAGQQQKYTPATQTQSDFDYKYNNNQQQQAINPYTRVPQVQPQQPVVTRRPTQVQAPISPTTTRTTSTRGRTRTSASSGTSSSSTRSRPTNKPKSSIVKGQSAPVRDVYLDQPSRPENIYETPTPNTPATKCKKDLCVLPDCSCGNKEIPGGLRAQDTPQIVLLTFDDSVNDLNKNLYRDLFEKGRKNPNGCPISATFYVSHEWTDYSQVQNLAADGHEIASHSVSHSFGEQYSQKKWDREINGQREILAAYGGVKMSEIRGMRAPFLAIGGNNMFKMLHDSNFTYDSSMPIYENRPPSWPYTLDYRIFHDCMIPPCPTKSYPGVWEVPMVMWQDLKGGRCSMGDACSNPPTAEGVYQMLAKNFERHYTTNRAPFGLYYHAAWFTQPHHKEGFEAFLDTLVQMDDVWLVTNWQALQWIRSPTPNNRALNFAPWSCHDLKDRPPRCNHPKVCNLWHKSGVRYMKTCQQCPQQYPWTGNTGVPYSNSL